MVNYSKTQFIKITDNNAHENFYIDITTMKDARLRISCLKNQYKKNKINEKEKEIFNLLSKDWSFCVIEKGDFLTYDDAKKRREELYKKYRDKLKV